MSFDPVWLAVALGCVTSLLSGLAAFRSRAVGADPLLADGLDDLRKDLSQLRTALADDLKRGRDETGSQARDLRQELQTIVARLAETLGGNIGLLGTAQAEKLEGVVANVKSLAEANERRLADMRRDADEGGKALRDEVGRQLKGLGEVLDGNLEKGAVSQKERLDGVATEIRRLIQSNAEANENLRRTVEGKLELLRTDNTQKLEEMRKTVDEKLQGTLEERLGEKFRVVSDHLERVHRSVGEMQALASGVGDLKKVLTNVKTRGTWAEVSLGSLLEQILTPEQFDRNVETVKGSNERVEFAIRLPGQEDGASVWLPIDAKFPSEDYERLVEASEAGDPVAVEGALKGLETRIKLEGAKICKKYVSPPETTDFGILYLPTEGLYAEVLRRPGLVDHLQGQCRIMVAGPTNLHAFLNSLRMGFRTLAIEKRSSEIRQTLGAVKTEFASYGDVLDKVQKKLTEAQNHIETVGRRGRAIERKLRGIDAIPEPEAVKLLALEAATQDGDLLDAAE
jgi:DNA recombination protein RmuC